MAKSSADLKKQADALRAKLAAVQKEARKMKKLEDQQAAEEQHQRDIQFALEFVQMAKDMPDYKFIWFGKTPLYSVPHKIRKAVKTKLPNLTFAGYVQPDELKQAYVGCDVYIFPTLEETEGIVLLEALAAKANVIVRDIPVFDWLNGGTDCYKAKDKDEFERMIKEIYEGKLPSLRENGRKAVENMDIKKIGEKLVKIYNGTAEGGD